MGATSFITRATGPSARAAFDQAVAAARADSLMDGDDAPEDEWCSNIGDKIDFETMPTPADLDVSDRQAVEEAGIALLSHPRAETFGPAFCLDLGPVGPSTNPAVMRHEYLFTGWSPE